MTDTLRTGASAALLAIPLVIAGCAARVPYVPPAMPMPSAHKEMAGDPERPAAGATERRGPSPRVVVGLRRHTSRRSRIATAGGQPVARAGRGTHPSGARAGGARSLGLPAHGRGHCLGRAQSRRRQQRGRELRDRLVGHTVQDVGAGVSWGALTSGGEYAANGRRRRRLLPGGRRQSGERAAQPVRHPRARLLPTAIARRRADPPECNHRRVPALVQSHLEPVRRGAGGAR